MIALTPFAPQSRKRRGIIMEINGIKANGINGK